MTISNGGSKEFQQILYVSCLLISKQCPRIMGFLGIN